MTPRFIVNLDKDASSPNPQVAIWRGQHQCVSEGFADDATPPSPERCGEIIIKHQLHAGHWSVLDQAFIKLNTAGFPHSVMVQMTRHRDSAFLVQSGRYTGERFIKVTKGELGVEDVFYFRPPGFYADRKAAKYEHIEEINLVHRARCVRSCVEYADLITSGYSEEHAREVIPYNFRQNFTVACTLKNFFHWLDQRGNKDSQLEIQVFAQMALEAAMTWAPELMTWYKDHRYTKARLAP